MFPWIEDNLKDLLETRNKTPLGEPQRNQAHYRAAAAARDKATFGDEAELQQSMKGRAARPKKRQASLSPDRELSPKRARNDDNDDHAPSETEDDLDPFIGDTQEA